MKVALIGYGKMGKAIETILTERNHTVIARFGSKGINEAELKLADVAIEFTRPEVAFSNLQACFNNQIPVITGTTGWLEDYDEAIKMCSDKNSALLYASNFSLGVNIFFELNKQLAKMMNTQSDYGVSIEEIHHTEKLDAPSGTAISLAEQITQEIEEKTNWTMEEPKFSEIPISAKRISGVPGTHTIEYTSTIDTIEIKHTAHSRKGFALGAVIAAEFINGKKGIYQMKDVLKF